LWALDWQCGCFYTAIRFSGNAQKEGKTMQSMTTKLMITAASLAIAGGVASAQTLRAEIPFAFRAGDKVMAPGTYYVKASDTRQYVVLANYETKDAAVVMAGTRSTPSKNWVAAGQARMAFQCGLDRCELSRIWTGPGEDALTFRGHGSGAPERASITEVRMTRAAD
jgi:hypothetical protein